MKYMRRTAGYIWTDYKTNAQIAKELKITPILDKLLEYKKNWVQHVNRMPRNRLPRVMKHYSPSGRRNHGRPLKRLLDTWDRNGSTSGPTPWQIYDDDGFIYFTSFGAPISHNSSIHCYATLPLHVGCTWCLRTVPGTTLFLRHTKEYNHLRHLQSLACSSPLCWQNVYRYVFCDSSTPIYT